MNLKNIFCLFLLLLGINLTAKTFLQESTDESRNSIQNQAITLAYIWPVYVSPLTLAEKDIFFTVARLVENKALPGSFIVKPLFVVPSETTQIPEAFQEYFNLKLPLLDKELIALQKVEIGSLEHHYIIPVKKVDDLLKIEQQFPEKAISIAIPEDIQEFELLQKTLKEQNIDLDQNAFNFLSSLSDVNNYIYVEELKDYIRKLTTHEESDLEEMI